MKNAFYYFSGTGNSLAIAKSLIKELNNELEIIPITDSVTPVEFDGEIFGLVFPVYNQSIPGIVYSFLKKLQIKGKPYIFAIATSNAEPGHSLFTVNRILGSKGQKLALGFNIDMPGNAIMNPSKIRNERLKNSKVKIPLIARAIVDRQQGILEGKNSFNTYLKGSILNFILKQISKLNKQFWVRENCNHCGVCTTICPQKNIIIDSQRGPIWGKRCECCLACFHWCPQQSIEIGKNTFIKERYHHPEVSINEMMVR